MFLQTPVHYLPLRSMYSPQGLTFTHSQVTVLPLNVTDQASHQQKTTFRTSAIYILLFTFLNIRQDDKFKRPGMVASISQM
jgi:hypothetical protein